MNIEESNKLIAEFMGYLGSAEDANLVYCMYHTSWDWLMPVVEKIRGIEEGMLVERIDIMPNDGVSIHITRQESIIVDVESKEATINATYKAVVEFIQWYNKQEK